MSQLTKFESGDVLRPNWLSRGWIYYQVVSPEEAQANRIDIDPSTSQSDDPDQEVYARIVASVFGLTPHRNPNRLLINVYTKVDPNEEIVYIQQLTDVPKPLLQTVVVGLEKIVSPT